MRHIDGDTVVHEKKHHRLSIGIISDAFNQRFFLRFGKFQTVQHGFVFLDFFDRFYTQGFDEGFCGEETDAGKQFARKIIDDSLFVCLFQTGKGSKLKLHPVAGRIDKIAFELVFFFRKNGAVKHADHSNIVAD